VVCYIESMAEDKPMVLIVEDEEMLLTAIVKKLELDNVEPKAYKNGREALDFLVTSEKLPKVIWLDYYLKDMNGLTFVTELRQIKKLSAIPVVVVSNSASLENVYQMETLGVNKYLLKADYRLEDIVKIMREFY
jgi:CheY-like chemotaxis protein